MAGQRAATYDCGDSFNQTQKLVISSQDQFLPDSAFLSDPSKPFLGSRAMLRFGVDSGVKGSGITFYRSFDQEESGDEYLDEYLNQPEKKRRLSVDQVQFLEKNFEAENKLEPERKIQLAKELGLQPRQIAVWFQNRRARWKTRQMETDYETLDASYKNLKTDYENLLEENKKLKAEVLHLKHNGLVRDSELTLQTSAADAISENGESKHMASAALQIEEQTNTDGIQSSVLETGNSSHVVEFDESDASHNGEDELRVELLQPDCVFPKTGDAYCHPPTSSLYYTFPVEDQAFSFWSY